MNQSSIVQCVRDVIEAMGYTCDDVELREDALMGGLVLNVRTPDARRLIGRDGEALHALHHVVRTILENTHRGEVVTPFALDIDNYMLRRIEHLKTKTHVIANRVRSFKSSEEMEPMSSYERLVVHTLLADMADIRTESIGEGYERRVVVHFKETSPNPSEGGEKVL